MITIPVFNFPTTIICVDDDKAFLENLSAGINSIHNHNTKCFYHPEDVIKFFKAYKSPLSKTNFLRGFTDHEYYDTLNHNPVDLDINSVINLSNQQDRFEEISIVIVDYDMPIVDGIELCKLLADLPVKKILLTGELDYEHATRALNDEIIDCFIPKSNTADFLPGVRANISMLEQRYFNEITKSLRKHLEASHPMPLSDPEFARFFSKYIKDNHIKEYYLSDKNGGFLTINVKNDRSYFVVQTDRSLDRLVDLYSDDDSLKDFVNTIKDRQKLPFFGVGKTLEHIDPKDLSTHLYQPQIIEGREKYYCYNVKL